MKMLLSAVVAIALTLGAIEADAAATPGERRVALTIESTSLATALDQWAQQSGFQIVVQDWEAIKNLTAPSLRGTYTAQAALDQLLAGTSLTCVWLSEKAVSIRRKPSPVVPTALQRSGLEGQSSVPVSKFSGDAAGSGSSRPSTVETENAAEGGSAAGVRMQGQRLEELLVTGTRIKGGAGASPTLVFTQEDFARAGVATAQQFLATLPQNFGGGQSDATLNEPGLQFNPSFGTAVNLRGVGSGSTLTLINGRRWAASGSAEFVDVSMIPLSAVKRIEIVADGASAIYGSDAVGGVVNFILQDQYDGADTRLRYGTTTEGGGAEYQAAQSLGSTWSRGSGFASYEYYRRDSVSSRDRSFSLNAVGPLELVPRQERHSVYGTVQQDLTEAVNLSVDAFYSTRDASYVDYDPSALEVNTFDADTQQYGGSVGVQYALGSDWTLTANAGSNRNRIGLDGASPAVALNSTDTQYTLTMVEAAAIGSIMELPSGKVKAAVGMSYRDEEYRFADNFNRFDGDFNVRAAYAEVLVPIIGNADPASDAARLSLTVAGRYERYTTFGDTLDPKFGLRWAVSDALTVRGTYGTSFRAPSLYQLNEFNGTYFLLTIPDAQSPVGFTRTAILLGNNPDLQEESATTWTLGIEIQPQALPGFRAEVTYFDVDYSDRIQRASAPPLFLINDSAYQELVSRRSSSSDPQFDARVAALLSGRIRSIGCAVPPNPTTRACAEPPANFGAIVDARLINLAGSRTNGIDVIASETLDTDVGAFEFALNASYLFNYSQRVAEAAPFVQLASTAGNPVDMRARASVTWNRNAWSVTGAINHVDGYTDNLAPVETGIGSWTTMDVNLQYDVVATQSLLSGTAFSLSVLNALDRDPPFFAHEAVGLGYDPANANPFGRSVYMSVAKRW